MGLYLQVWKTKEEAEEQAQIRFHKTGCHQHVCLMKGSWNEFYYHLMTPGNQVKIIEINTIEVAIKGDRSWNQNKH